MLVTVLGWMANTSIFINEGTLELDHVGGHYILKKQ